MNDALAPFIQPHRLVKPAVAASELLALGEDFAILENPGVAFPSQDIVPLAPKRLWLDDAPEAILIDMDGTTATTEDLCCQGMEDMLRRMSGLNHEIWPGLNAEADYPALIGYSAMKNFEYLRYAYGHLIDEQCTLRAFIEAVAWNLGPKADPAVRDAIERRLRDPGLVPVFEDARFSALRNRAANGETPPQDSTASLLETHIERVRALWRSDSASVGLTIYCENYHRCLSAPADAPEAAGIRPNPGVAIFMALVKGVLGHEAAQCAEHLADALRRCGIEVPDIRRARALLGDLGKRFEAAPPRIALVTSSSAYEAHHVLRHVFHHLAAETATWALSPACLERVRAAFSDPSYFYDAIITSSDVPSTRLKPHRDPYAAALRQLDFGACSRGAVIGFEDTEPGIVSLRGAGVGLAVAVPIAGTQAHDFSAAAHVVKGGFPDLLLQHGMFLRPPDVEPGLPAASLPASTSRSF